MTNWCFVLDGKPLKIFAGRGGTPIDGVVRNVAFTNTATNTTIKSPCAVPTDSQAALFLNSFRESNKPMVLGLYGRSLSHFQSFISHLYILILQFLERYINNNLNFEYGENTDPYNGCSAMLNGQMYYFGGVETDGYSRQVK